MRMTLCFRAIFHFSLLLSLFLLLIVACINIVKPGSNEVESCRELALMRVA